MGDERKTGALMAADPPLGKRVGLDDSLVNRRDVVKLLSGAVVAWPIAAYAQHSAMPVIGYFNSGRADTQVNNLKAFRASLKEAGFVEGKNGAIEFHWAENKFDRLPSMAAELVRRPLTLIVSNTLAALQAKAATTTIPIVFTTGSDPVRDRLVTSLNRPGGNITGVVFITGELGAKRLAMLRQLVPKATTIAMLVYPDTPETEAERKDVRAAAQAIGQAVIFLDVRNTGDIETEIAKLASLDAGALLVGTGPFMFNNHKLIVAQALRRAIPALGSTREYSVAGGLMSYGSSISDAFRQAGVYAGRILKGERPGELPVIRSTKFDLVINLKTAKVLGLEIPPTLLALADEVIE
jgi:putative ABC transport system substrate-binding protein